MTSTSQNHRPNRVRPNTVRNRIMWVLSQHGIEPTTAESIWAALTTGDDPMPNGVPRAFKFEGITITYPTGVGARLLYPAERKALNAALKRYGYEQLDSEDNALEGRRAYRALYNKTRVDGYVDPTSVKARMDTLVQEATEFHGTADELTDRAQALIRADNVLCGHRKPHGRLLCLQDNHHDGLHKNGTHTWSETDVVKIQRVATNKRNVKAQPAPAPTKTTSELDTLLTQLNDLTTQAL